MRNKILFSALLSSFIFSFSVEAKMNDKKSDFKWFDNQIVESNEYQCDDSREEALANRVFWNCVSASAYCYNNCPTMVQACTTRVTGLCRGRDFLFADGSSSCLIVVQSL